MNEQIGRIISESEARIGDLLESEKEHVLFLIVQTSPTRHVGLWLAGAVQEGKFKNYSHGNVRWRVLAEGYL